MDPFVLAALHFILVHGPDGQEVRVNIHEIIAIRKPREGADDHFARGTNCIVQMSDSKNINTAESCVDIAKLISAAEKSDVE